MGTKWFWIGKIKRTYSSFKVITVKKEELNEKLNKMTKILLAGILLTAILLIRMNMSLSIINEDEFNTKGIFFWRYLKNLVLYY